MFLYKAYDAKAIFLLESYDEVSIFYTQHSTQRKQHEQNKTMAIIERQDRDKTKKKIKEKRNTVGGGKTIKEKKLIHYRRRDTTTKGLISSYQSNINETFYFFAMMSMMNKGNQPTLSKKGGELVWQLEDL